MHSDKIIISGTGCALADYLYNRISFNSEAFEKYRSEKSGDGGLSPGKLVFTEELEKFASKSYREIIRDIIGNREADAFNIGGPSLVSLIHTAQLLGNQDYEVRFFGMAGKDDTASRITRLLNRTPLNISHYQSASQLATPFTHVLSDPDYHDGHGERTFINNIGAAWEYSPDMLADSFFESDIVCFGGTALVPKIHDSLTMLLKKSGKNDCITVVNTVFDFRNEKINPGHKWPLVTSDQDLALIDVLIMDCEEALRISGENMMHKAADFFKGTGVSSFIITNGAEELIAYSRGGLFEKKEQFKLPVSKKIAVELQNKPERKGDTTGCGDNFAGGIIASVAWQLKSRKKGELDLIEALSWGISSGGFCCFTIGGTYLENYPGEKKKEVEAIQKNYLDQIGRT